jgi:hypothetical protein
VRKANKRVIKSASRFRKSADAVVRPSAVCAIRTLSLLEQINILWITKTRIDSVERALDTGSWHFICHQLLLPKRNRSSLPVAEAGILEKTPEDISGSCLSCVRPLIVIHGKNPTATLAPRRLFASDPRSKSHHVTGRYARKYNFAIVRIHRILASRNSTDESINVPFHSSAHATVTLLDALAGTFRITRFFFLELTYYNKTKFSKKQ